MSTIWRRFRPRGYAAQLPGSGEIYQAAWQLVEQIPVDRRRMWQRHDVSALVGPIDGALARAEQTGDPVQYLAALILQAPRAVLSQRSMDKHPGGFHNREARLYELIAFNDTYVSLILALPESYYAECNDHIKRLMDQFCRRVRAPRFTNQQWEAITHGLSREISVYRGALSLGYQARMTSRREDAMGVDMVLTGSDGIQTNLDIKTRSSFHFRLQDLAREGRISELEREEAEKFGHITVTNGHGSEAVRTTLLRIDEETYGRTINFAIERLEPLRDSIQQIVTTIRRHDERTN